MAFPDCFWDDAPEVDFIFFVADVFGFLAGEDELEDFFEEVLRLTGVAATVSILVSVSLVAGATVFGVLSFGKETVFADATVMDWDVLVGDGV